MKKLRGIAVLLFAILLQLCRLRFGAAYAGGRRRGAGADLR